MKTRIMDWADECKGILSEVGLEKGQEILPGLEFPMAEVLFKKGLNVMIFHRKDQDETVLAVDTKRFTQR